MNDSTVELQKKLRDAENKVRTTESALKNAKSRRLKWSAWSAVAGFLLFAVGGQWFPGYQLDSTAAVTSNKMATSAVSDIMAQLCAERFMMRTSGFESRLAAFNDATGDWNKTKYIREGTWTDTPNGEKSDHATAEKCIGLITERLSKEPATTS
jgi:hypothetical protein